MDLSHKNLRRTILTMAYKAQSGHIGCALSIVTLLSEIFSDFKQKDVFILSKGHGVMALYAVYLEMGWISQGDIDNYLKDGSKLHGLAEHHVCGASTGSLGHGLPIAAGVALAKKLKNEAGTVYCLVGDGEMQEGSCYEALMFSDHNKLNLKIIVDWNHLQAMGRLKEISSATAEHPLLNWRETVKGHGVSFMENDNSWHYRRMTKDEYDRAMSEQG